MKELYGLPEIHWMLSGFIPRIKNKEIFRRISDVLTDFKLDELSVTYEKRKKKIQRFLQKYNPKVVFVEGISCPEIEEIYSGKVIYLDKCSESYRKFADGMELILSKYKALKDLLFKELFKTFLSSSEETRLQKIGKANFWEKAIAKSIVNIQKNEESEIRKYLRMNFRLATIEREKEWAKVISNYYESPSCIIAGVYHFLGDLNNDLNILVNSIRHKIFHSLVFDFLERYKGLDETLTYFLKQRGIKLKVSDCLFYILKSGLKLR